MRFKKSGTANDDVQRRIKDHMEGGIKRLGALFLKVCAVPMVPIGLGIMLYGLFSMIEQSRWEDPLSIGVAIVVMGALLWVLSRKLDEAASLVRYRRQQNRLLRLAQQRQGRLSVTEAATDSGLTVEEAEKIMKDLADRGYVELEVTDSGMMVYRFPEILFGHEKVWSRSIDRA
jgi:hypothetical protein